MLLTHFVSVARRFQSLNTDKDEMLSFAEVANLPELRVNPFTERIQAVFSDPDSDGLSFEDFLDLMSVFHETVRLMSLCRLCNADGDDPAQASHEIKASYAFRIYGTHWF